MILDRVHEISSYVRDDPLLQVFLLGIGLLIAGYLTGVGNRLGEKTVDRFHRPRRRRLKQ